MHWKSYGFDAKAVGMALIIREMFNIKISHFPDWLRRNKNYKLLGFKTKMDVKTGLADVAKKIREHPELYEVK